LDEFLRSQEGPNPEKLLLKYPLGYVIFYATYSESVFPYETRGEMKGWQIDWTVFSCHETDDHLDIRPPDVSVNGQHSGFVLLNNAWNIPKRVGAVVGFESMNGVAMAGEVLKINSDGVVFLIGFRRDAAR
jgi:hypothetical protein